MKTVNSRPFYLSDNPVTLQNQNDYSPYGNLGIGVRGIEIYMPLSSKLALAVFCRSLEKQFVDAYDKYLYIKSIDPTFQLQKNRPAPGLEEMVSGLKTGKPVDVMRDNVINHNALQVMYSSRFVFSSNDNFTLAKQMIKEQPKYKKGPKAEIN